MIQYKTKYVGGHELRPSQLEEFLNSESKKGWEYVDVIINRMINDPMEIATYNFIFKQDVTKKNN